MELAAAIAEHVSLVWIEYVAQLPSGFGCGEKSGNEPGEQHTYWPTAMSLQKLGSLLYCWSSACVILHLWARDQHPSFAMAWTYVHVSRGRTLVFNRAAMVVLSLLTVVCLFKTLMGVLDHTC